MPNMKLILCFICSVGLWLNLSAQLVPTFSWSSYLPYNQALCISESEEYIFTGTTTGIFRTAKSDNSIRRFAKEDGMADLYIAAIGYSSVSEALIAGYKNGNIDVLLGNEWIHMPDLYTAQSIANKEIYNIVIKQNLAYICAGFGIAVVDLNNQKFKSSVVFQPAGQPEIAVYDLTFKNNSIYAATAKGIYVYQDNQLFEDFSSWSLQAGLPNGAYRFVEYFDGNLYAVFSNQLSNSQPDSDTLFIENGGSFLSDPTVEGHSIGGLHANRNKLSITYKKQSSDGNIRTLNENNSVYLQLSSYLLNRPNGPLYAQNGKVYVADGFFGLLGCKLDGKIEVIQPEGPFSNYARKIWVNKDNLAMITGGFTSTYGPAYISDGLFFKKENTWTFQNHINQPLMSGSSDFVCLEKVNKEEHVFFAGALSGGLYKFDEGLCVEHLDHASSGGSIGNASQSSVYALKSDIDGNLIIAHNGNAPISILKKEGSIVAFPVPGINSGDKVLDIEIIDSENIWFAIYGKGIAAVQHEDYIIQNFRFLNTAVGSGKLPSMFVTSLALDKDGEIWAGTNNGFSIFYNPLSVFQSGVNIDSSQPIVKASDGNNEPVLKGSNITDIGVDGGNRKWICMIGAGATLLSEDGFIIEQAFTKENSPLLSDNVFHAGIDPESGMVHFSTESGISIFRSDASEAEEMPGEVYAFPNPVRPGYSGILTIRGLAENSEVKITDTNGQLVYETVAHGGTAIWNLYGFNGIRARAGVYLIFANGINKKSEIVSKVLIMP